MTSSSENKHAVLYGRKGVLQLLEHSPKRVKQLFLAEDAKLSPALQKSIKENFSEDLIVKKSKDELSKLAEHGVHQGVVALIEPKQELSFKEFLQSQKAGVQADSAPLVVLDQITDPHNFGAILRSASAAGVETVLYTGTRSSGVTPLVRKASAGGSEFLRLVKLKNLQQSLGQLKELGYWIIGTEVTGTSSLLYSTELPTPSALVFGREGEGLRELTIKQCDMLVHLPMCGAIESLNVSQAASIVLYEALRRRLAGQSK